MIEDRRSLGVLRKAELILRCVSKFFQMLDRYKYQRTIDFVLGKVFGGKSVTVFRKLCVVRPFNSYKEQLPRCGTPRCKRTLS